MAACGGDRVRQADNPGLGLPSRLLCGEKAVAVVGSHAATDILVHLLTLCANSS